MAGARAAPATVVGLGLALLGPPLVAVVFAPVGVVTLRANLAAQACLVLVAVAVVLVARLGERRPLSTLGVRAPRAASFAWAALLVVVNVYVVAPLMTALVARLGARDLAPTVRALAALPAWYRGVIIVVDASIEELLYRGYALDRLAAVLRSRAAAVVVSSLVFAYAHAPLWGFGVSTALVLPALVMAAFYVWTRDLPALVMAHVVTDFIGLVVRA